MYSTVATILPLQLILPNHVTKNVNYACEMNELDSVNADNISLYVIQFTAVELFFTEIMQRTSHGATDQFAPSPILSF